MRVIESSELILNPDGSIFHLHLKPEQLADTVILVGDPGRVETVSAYFDKIEHTVSNREFKTCTGYYKGKKISAVSTGIGTDNIDIVVNELDALVNIDLNTRTVKDTHKKLTLVRLGTSGALQPEIDLGSYVMTEVSIGFDGLLNFYANRNEVSELEMEQAFLKHTNWNPLCAKPYFNYSSSRLVELFADFTIRGITISAPGFYGPQGRVLRLPLSDPKLNDKIVDFEYKGRKITNFEMESSAIYGLSKMLGHEALTVCLIIANRVAHKANENYHSAMKNLITSVLDRLTTD